MVKTDGTSSSAPKHSPLKGATASLVVQSGTVILGLGVSVVLSRVLGAQGFGEFTLFLVVFTLLGLPVHKGMRAFMVREVSSAREAADGLHLAAVLKFSRQVIFCFSVGLGILVAIMTLALPEIAPPALTLIAALIVPFLAILERQGAILTGLGHPIAGQIPEQILRHAILILLVLAAVGTGLVIQMTPLIAMGLSCCAIALSLLAMAPFLRQALASCRWGQSGERRRSGWLKSMFLLSAVFGLAYLNQRIDLLAIGLLMNPEAVGIYRVAGQVAMLVAIPQIAVNRLVSPDLSAHFRSGDRVKMQRILSSTSIYALVGGIPLALGVVLFESTILEGVFGSEFAEGAHSLSILTLGYLASALFGSVGAVLTMIGHERDAAWGMAIAAGSNLFLNVPMVLWLGMQGAAIATVISLVIWNAYLSWKVFQRTGLISTVILRPFMAR